MLCVTREVPGGFCQDDESADALGGIYHLAISTIARMSAATESLYGNALAYATPNTVLAAIYETVMERKQKIEEAQS